MVQWNVLATTHKDGYRRALDLLGKYGPVKKSEYYNVLTLRADDPRRMMEDLREKIALDPDILHSVLARVVPVSHTFHFSSPAEFEEQARKIALSWAPQLAGKGFHVCLHRRGFKKRLSSMEEERFLDHALLTALQELNHPGHIVFAEAEAIIMVETLGTEAGLSLWNREELARYPFLHPA